MFFDQLDLSLKISLNLLNNKLFQVNQLFTIFVHHFHLICLDTIHMIAANYTLDDSNKMGN